ncbi:MAG: thioredoxin domain-containing protein [Candidatus Aenigmarchaeota archaeon]|nr:thioredoxin domain-containing protein [Candidatus Aenigmarchaeota archaeon]
MKIKTVHILGIIILVAVIAGGYMFSQQQQPIVSGDQFVSYAGELKLDTTQFKSCFDSSKYESQIQSDRNEGLRLQVKGTPTFYVNGQEILGGTYDDLKAAIDSALAGGSANTVNLGQLPPRGNSSSNVVVVEFSDFQCPFCKRAEPTIKKILSDYGDKIKFVYMDFPLTQIHRFADRAANAARCANEQGKFWEYHDILFDRQSEWALS